MTIQKVISALEKKAPILLQENYDNAGLLTGNSAWECTGIIVALDAIEMVIQEAIENNCNLVVVHHPIIFSGLKKLTGKSYVEKTIIRAIKNDIAIYAIHTNLDNVMWGVNGKIADKLGLINRQVLQHKNSLLKKLAVFVPATHSEILKEAIFAAGAGQIGNYSECSFNTPGEGTFKGAHGTNPFIGKPGERYIAHEIKVEVIYFAWLEQPILNAMHLAHPYEEIAYDIISLQNHHQQIGSGLVGDLPQPVSEAECLHLLKQLFNLSAIRHTPFTGEMVQRIALCGGAGSFLIGSSIASGAQIYITADIKYHEFFDADGNILIADIGHYESEQFTIDLLFEILKENFTTFAVLKTGIKTNPVQYFL